MFQTFIQHLTESLFIENVVLVSTESGDMSTATAIKLVKRMSRRRTRISAVMDEAALTRILRDLGAMPAIIVAIGKQAPRFLAPVKSVS